MGPRQIDGLWVVSVLFLLFVGSNVMRDRFSAHTSSVNTGQAAGVVAASFAMQSKAGNPLVDPEVYPAPSDTMAFSKLDPNTLAFPYDDYIVTQGPHGFEYGHMAIDISAGKDAVIRSPISGVITSFFTDAVGSTILIIENDRWQITLVHGLFSVSAGDEVRIGQPIGVESNQGNTVDLDGRSCRGRDCGYHTHINIFDKQIGANINPLDLFP